MGLIRRSLTSIIRNKGKTIILFLIIFILSNVMAGAVSIKESSKSIEKQVKIKLGAIARIEIDYEEIEKHMVEEKTDDGQIVRRMPHIERLTDETIRTIANSKYVKAFDYVSSGKYYSRDLKEWYNGAFKWEMGQDKNVTNIHANGTDYNKILKVEHGIQTIESGRVFTKEEIENGDYVTVINENFANLNNLKVDDNLIINVISYDFEKMFSPGSKKDYEGRPEAIVINEKEIPLKIIGIYRDKRYSDNKVSSKGSYVKASSFDIQKEANSIYIPNKTNLEFSNILLNFHLESKGLEKREEEDIYKENIFMLKNPVDIDKFKAESEPLLPNFMIIRSTTDEYKKIAGPIEKSTNMANYVLIVSVIAFVLIVSLVTILFLRDRKYEFGIYLSLGEKRTKLISQILIEVLVISVIAISFSIFTGNIIADSLSSSIIKEEEIDISRPNRNKVHHYSNIDSYMLEDVSKEDVLDIYRVELTNEYIIMFVIISLSTISMATIIPMLYIMRLNPKKIMM